MDLPGFQWESVLEFGTSQASRHFRTNLGPSSWHFARATNSWF